MASIQFNPNSFESEPIDICHTIEIEFLLHVRWGETCIPTIYQTDMSGMSVDM